jgi:hypothetical protein
MPLMSLRSDIDIVIDEHISRCPNHGDLLFTVDRTKSVLDLMSKISYRDWNVRVEATGGKMRFQLNALMKDSMSDAVISNSSRTIDLCPNMSDGLIVDIVFEMIKEFEMHEAAEHYLLSGRRVFFPHDRLGIPVRFVRAQR